MNCGALLAVILTGLGVGAVAAEPRPLVPVRRATATGAHWMLLGRSEQGRPILADRVGDPTGTRVLVFGCIHGNETAGIAIARALEHVRTVEDIWIVPDLNPDGVARGTRQDARGVDLNRNWSWQWPRGGRPFDTYYGGPRPFSDRESGMRLYHHHWLPGTASNWQNHHLPGTASVTVELPAGALTHAQVRRHLRAVLSVARALSRP